MAKIYTVGETTFDILFRNDQPTGAVVGGSLLNTSVALGRLGIPVNFISRMGNDQIGDLSLKFLMKNGVKCDYITRFEGNSRLALAFMDESNNASYEFYKAEKSPSLNFPELNSEDIVVFGSTNALRDEGRNSLLLFLNQAHDKNVLTIYDPNIREFGPLEMIDVKKKFEENLFLSKILKGSNVDFERLYESCNPEEIFKIVKKFGVEVLIITYGSEPVQVITEHLSFTMPVPAVETVSTIGAGDNFNSGLVLGIIQKEITTNKLKETTEYEWKEIFASALRFAAEVCCSEANYISKDFADYYLQNQMC